MESSHIDSPLKIGQQVRVRDIPVDNNCEGSIFTEDIARTVGKFGEVVAVDGRSYRVEFYSPLVWDEVWYCRSWLEETFLPVSPFPEGSMAARLLDPEYKNKPLCSLTVDACRLVKVRSSLYEYPIVCFSRLLMKTVSFSADGRLAGCSRDSQDLWFLDEVPE